MKQSTSYLPTFRTVFVAFGLAFIMTSFLRAANAVIAPDLMRDIGMNASQLGQMTSMYYATYALMQLPMGAALDRYGSRLVIPLLMIPTVIGCFVYASATSFLHVSVARLLIGVGTAGALMGAVKTFGHWVRRERLAAMTASLVAIGTVGGILSTSPMAWLNDITGWRTIFLGSALIVATTAIGIRVFTRDTPQGPHPQPPTTGNPFHGFGDIFRAQPFWYVAPVYFSMLGTLLAVQTLWAGPFLYDVYGASTTITGISLLLMSIGSICGYLISGALFVRIGVTRLILSAQGVLIACLAAWTFAAGVLPVWTFFVVYVLFGAAAAFNVIMLPQVRSMFPDAMSGRATTALNVFGFAGAWMLQWVMGVVIQYFGRTPTGAYQSIGYQWAFSIPLNIAVVGLLLYWPIHRLALRKE